MKIIEELESLENGPNPALSLISTGLAFGEVALYDFAASLAALNVLQLKYPQHRLLIGNKGEYDWSEFALFGERDETELEKSSRLNKEKRNNEAEKIKIQKQIELLEKRAAKLKLKI